MWRIVLVLLFIASGAASAGVISLNSDKDVGLTITRTPPPVSTPTRWLQVADALGALIPESKITCVKDVLGQTLFARSSSADSEDVWKSNSSVKAYNQLRLSRSPCLAVLTDRYYRDINKARADGEEWGSRPDRVNAGRPALNAKLGQGSFADKKPGFALESAMKLAQGNRAVAMALVGHCGHDDIENSLPTVIDFSKSPESGPVVSAYLRGIRERRGKGQSPALKGVIDVIGQQGNTGLKIDCPRSSSSFYAPGALGADVDISADLKKKISSLQAPTKGPGALPAKAYHTSFAAVMGCRLGACGMSEDGAAKLLSKIASMYRGNRQSATTSKYDSVRLLIEAQFGVNWNDTRGLEKESAAIAAWLESDEGRRQIIAVGGSEFLAENRAKMNWDMWKKNIDASILTRSGPSGEVWNAPPLSAGRDPYFQDGTGIRPQQSFCPGWSEERCTSARERRDTWRTDFDWTEGQQLVGGRFGAKFCQGQPAKDEEIEKQACQALQRLDADLSSPSTQTSPADAVPGVE